MQFRSKNVEGYTIFAVSGVNTVSFAIDFTKADTKGLLGFAVERHNLASNKRYYMYGFKVFKDSTPNPNQNTVVSTYDNPVQSFVWDDFTAEADTDYIYYFHPLKGDPKHIDRSATAIEVAIHTEPLFSETATHDVFFNRGVASSQAYARKFGNKTPDQITDTSKKAAAFDWLARDLKKALITFIAQAKKGDALFGCFYEFHYPEIVAAFKAAIDRGVQVKIIIDAKQNAQNFPRTDNLQAITAARITAGHIIKREANPSSIQHNKFIIFEKAKKPTAVWTGSTNISEGGLFGQTNVGHWVRDAQTAVTYKKYWQLLADDPGGSIAKTKAYKQAVVGLQNDIAPDTIATGITPIFSPRPTDTMLHTYAGLLDSAKSYAAITLAFGIGDVFKALLADNTPKDHITFMLLEKKDKSTANQAKKFTYLNAGNNVYEAFGSYIKDPLYQWTKETNNQLIKLNQHVLYIHSKFLLVDPLGEKPIVVTGSANFSTASTTTNDENMLIIKGNKRAADIYFTEFNRLFNHYYFRSVYESVQASGGSSSDSLFLQPNDSWLAKYKPGTLRYKRVKIFGKIKGD